MSPFPKPHLNTFAIAALSLVCTASPPPTH